MLDISNIYRQELLGLAIRGERLLDISNIYSDLERARRSPPLCRSQRNNNNNTVVSGKGGPLAANRIRIPSIEGRKEEPSGCDKMIMLNSTKYIQYLTALKI